MKKAISLVISSIFCFISIKAQNIECIGNTINIPLSGYKAGKIQWQFSSDRNIWNNLAGKTTTNLQYTIIGTGYFRAKVTYGQCDYYSDTTFIQAYPIPTASNAGLDKSITNLDTFVTLSANTPTIGKGKWTLVSGVGGFFTNDTLPNTTFKGKPCNDYTLRWTISTGCMSKTDEVNIGFHGTPTTSNAGSDQTITNLDTIVTLSANTPTIGKGKWSIVSGSGGVLANDTLLNTAFRGKACNDYTLRWTISTGCMSKTDDVYIGFHATPTLAYAGTDFITSNTDTTVILSANTPVVGKGKWSIILGTGGIFEKDTMFNTSFKGYRNSDYTLRWTISTQCSSTYDNVGINFGSIVKDIDNNVYDITQIGSQTWMADNLKTTRYNDGVVIIEVKDGWSSLSSAAYCNYDNDTNNVTVYGRLYNGYVITTTNNVCPAGWHVPSIAEWDTLVYYLGGIDVAGGKIKSLNLWKSPNTGAMNAYNFSALPAGSRYWDGSFSDLTMYGYFWTSSTGNNNGLFEKHISYSSSKLNSYGELNKRIANSIRCVKDK